MKNKKVFRFIRFLKEHKALVVFKKTFYSENGIQFRAKRFKHRYDNADTSKMNIFEYLRYVNERNVFAYAFSFFNSQPYYGFWENMQSYWFNKMY